MKKTLLLAFIFITVMSEAQILRYSFKAAANYVIIPDVKSSESLQIAIPPSVGYGTIPATKATIRQSFEGHAGFDAGASLDYGVSKKFFLTTGLSVSYLRFKQSITIEDIQTNTIDVGYNLPDGVIVGAPIGSIKFDDISSGGDQETPLLIQGDKNGETTTCYVQTSMLAGTSMLKDRLIIRGGATFSFLTNATTYKTTASYTGTTFTTQDVKVDSRDGFSELLASATLQATYLVTKRIGVDFSANKYLSPVYSENKSSKNAKYNTLSLGVSYSIGK